jgi:hypothetical protein
MTGLAVPVDEAETRAFRRRRLTALVAAVALGLALAGLVFVGASPTGAPTADDVVPAGSRVAARAEVGGAVVMVTAEGTGRSLVVAHRGAKGWFGAHAPRPEPGAPVAWTSSEGGGGVPALSAVYGRTAGAARVEIVWSDGRRQRQPAGSDGTWLAVRRGRVAVRTVRILGAGGVVIEQVRVP